MNFPSRILSFLLCINTVYCATFTVYEDPDRTSTSTFLWWGGGASEQFTVDEGSCMNFNFYNDKISSIDPHGGCVKVWQHGSCSGKSLIVTDTSGCSRNLAACDISRVINANWDRSVSWDNAISSISTCSEAEENLANRPVDNGDLEEHDMLLLNSNNVKLGGGDLLTNIISIVRHRSTYFVVKLCKFVDCKRQERIDAQARSDSCADFGETWDRQVNVVATSFDCVQVFDEFGCEGESMTIPKTLSFSALQTNSCKGNLTKCGWNNRIRSIKECDED